MPDMGNIEHWGHAWPIKLLNAQTKLVQFKLMVSNKSVFIYFF